MDKSEDATSKCFSGVLRRLLCTGSLPTYPSDQIPESNTTNNNNFAEKASKTNPESQPQPQPQATPGVVARLMGLDSMPNTPKHRTLESILRSKSVNYTAYMPEFDPTHSASQHRRVRTSVSFRETPTFFNQQSPDFFVLCFEKALNKASEKRANERNFDKGVEEVKLKKAETSKNRANTRDRDRVVSVKERSDRDNKNKKVCKGVDKQKRVFDDNSSNGSNVLAHNKDCYRKVHSNLKPKSPKKAIKSEEVLIESSLTKKKNQNVAANVKPKCNSVKSSAVPLFEAPMSGVKNSSSTAKSSSKITNYDCPKSKLFHTLNTDEDQELRMSSPQADKPVKTQETECFTDLLVQVCRLAEENMLNSKWVTQGVFNFDDFEEICIGFENQIFELLLNQVADELVGLHRLKNVTL